MMITMRDRETLIKILKFNGFKYDKSKNCWVNNTTQISNEILRYAGQTFDNKYGLPLTDMMCITDNLNYTVLTDFFEENGPLDLLIEESEEKSIEESEEKSEKEEIFKSFLFIDHNSKDSEKEIQKYIDEGWSVKNQSNSIALGGPGNTQYMVSITITFERDKQTTENEESEGEGIDNESN